MQGKVSLERSAKTPIYVGIDVCKTRLDVYLHPLGRRLTFASDPEGIKRLKRSLAGFEVAVVNPLRSRLFAEAVGALAKTGGVDCRMLAIMGESLDPSVSEPPDELMESLQELVRCRDAAAAARTALLIQLAAMQARTAALEINRQLRAAETAIENLSAEIERLVAADPVLARRLAILTSIPGIGTAIALIAGLSEIGSLSAKEAAMITGLAPIARESDRLLGPKGIERMPTTTAGW